MRNMASFGQLFSKPNQTDCSFLHNGTISKYVPKMWVLRLYIRTKQEGGLIHAALLLPPVFAQTYQGVH